MNQKIKTPFLEVKMFNLEYKITDYGLYFAIKGKPCKYDIAEHISSLKDVLDRIESPFNILVDLSEIDHAVCCDTSRLLEMGRVYAMSKGAYRIGILYRSSADIVDVTQAFNKMSIQKRERYVSTMIDKNAKESLENYLRTGVEP